MAPLIGGLIGGLLYPFLFDNSRLAAEAAQD
ncbi:aquaporin Z [Mycobacteroides abscessus subsp. abscessus]|nr:aquaporin Z [Mycobacteroides abscessus subsp. abscessus]